MFYIVGLGNPGEKYANSRHNIGWHVLDALVQANNLPTPLSEKQFSGKVTKGEIGNLSVTVLYPDTYMNHSGSAIKKLVPKGEADKLIVIYDDIALPFGSLRLSFGRGSGGHNGVESIIQSIGTKDFMRVRIGIGKVGFWPWEDKSVVRRPQGDALVKFVLGNFTRTEQVKLPEVCAHATQVIEGCVRRGYSSAMNTHNQ